MIDSTIQIHTATYTINKADGRVLTRPVELAVVRRRRTTSGGHTSSTQVVVVDAGSATRARARAKALTWTPQIVTLPEVDHGDLGTFGDSDADRDLVLSAIRALPLVGPVTLMDTFDGRELTPGEFDQSNPYHTAFRGRAPLTVLTDAS